MKYLKKFNENINDIVVYECDKSKAHYDFIAKYLKVLDNKDFFFNYTHNRNIRQVCAYYNDKLVGVSYFIIKNNELHMKFSAVDEEYRNMGINKKMKLKIIEIGKKNGCVLIASYIRLSNKASINSQKSIGFKIDDSFDATYTDGEKMLRLYLDI